MKIRIFPYLLLLILCGCSSSQKMQDSGNPLYGQMDNTREFGTIVSVNEDSHNVTKGVGSYLASAGANTGATAAAAATSGSIISPITNMFSSANQLQENSAPTSDHVNTLHYVIRKNDGSLVKIDQDPETGEPVLYPGQKAMIQMNNGYMRVYPGDVENLLH